MKRILSIFLCVLTVFSLSACSENEYSEETVYYSDVDTVNSFDPQLASTSVELNIANACFEGLLTTDKNGKIVCGAAESYTVSEDKLTYKFILRKDMVWSDGETEVTAADFEFGIKRAVKKTTASPFASSLYCIENAEKINKGKLGADSLGVKADGNELTIRLSYPDETFLSVLTQPVCAPCNETFFNETLGKYGLSNSKIISNGAFYILSYNKDDKTVGIYNNLNYTGKFKAKVKSVSLNYSSDYKDIYKAFENSDIDIAPIESTYIKSLEKNGYKSRLYYNTNYCLYIADSSISENLRKGLIFGIDSSTVKNNLDDFYNEPLGVVPKNNTVGNEVYRKKVGNLSFPVYNKEKADKLIGNYDKAADKLNSVKLYYPENDAKLELISNLIVQGWQKNFNLFINSAPASEKDIKSELKSGEYKMAIIPIRGSNNIAVNSINSLSEYGFSSKLPYTATAEDIFNRETSLVKSGKLYPVVAVPDIITYAEDVDNVITSADGVVIDFRFITK